MKQEWIEATYEWIDEFTHQKDYLRLLELAKVIQTDEHILSLVELFQQSQQKYQECTLYGDYHPDLPRYKKQFQQDKETLYTHPLIREYKKLEKHIQSQLDDVSKQIAVAISPKIKHPNAIGLISKHR